MNTMQNLTQELISEISNTEQKKIIIENKELLTPEQEIAIKSIERIKNPFAMIGLDYIMKDLKISKNTAYDIFQREDFPSINIGKSYKIMYMSYIIWKMKKRV